MASAALIIHSCKKENKTQSLSDPALNQAKIWYESTYPAAGNARMLVTQNTRPAMSSNFDFSQHIKPDWNHAKKYTRLGKSVIELPVDPSTPLASAIKNQTTGKILNPKENSHNSFVLLNDGKNYEAYVMTLLADSAYVKSHPGWASANTYQKRDPDFSGLVLYFTPKGQYVSGYAFRNGQQVIPATPSAATSNTASKGQLTRAFRPTARVEQIYDCTAWYLVEYDQWGNITSETFLYYTDCTPEPGSSTTDSGGGGSPSTATPPPPQCQPPGGGAVVVNNGLTRVTQPPPGGGDGGMPPPQTCPAQATVPLPDTTGCGVAAALSALATNAVQAAQEATILNNTVATGIENGANQNLTSWPGSNYMNTPVTPGTATTWPPTFTWDATNGYTVGFKHGHGSGDAPSPVDIAAIVYPIGNNHDLINAGPAAMQFYKANTSVTAETTAGNYTVTISDWTGIQTTIGNSFATPAQILAFNTNYSNLAKAYGNANPGTSLGDATAYALTQLFGNAITIYFKAAGSTNYTPFAITTDASGNKTLVILQCP